MGFRAHVLNNHYHGNSFQGNDKFISHECDRESSREVPLMHYSKAIKVFHDLRLVSPIAPQYSFYTQDVKTICDFFQNTL